MLGPCRNSEKLPIIPPALERHESSSCMEQRLHWPPSALVAGGEGGDRGTSASQGQAKQFLCSDLVGLRSTCTSQG